MFRYLISLGRHLLYHPRKVLLICVVTIFAGLFMDGTFIRLWSLSRQEDRLHQQLTQLQQENGQLTVQLEKAKDPAYIERMARDRFDLVADDELIFVFDDE